MGNQAGTAGERPATAICGRLGPARPLSSGGGRAKPGHRDDAACDRHDDTEDQRDSEHGQDKRDGDGKVAGGRPVRRWSPRPLLRPWCRCPLAAAVAAHTWWVGDRRLTLRPRQPACRMSGLEAAEGASRSDNRQPRAANERLWQKAWVGGFGVASTRALPSFRHLRHRLIGPLHLDIQQHPRQPPGRCAVPRHHQPAPSRSTRTPSSAEPCPISDLRHTHGHDRSRRRRGCRPVDLSRRHRRVAGSPRHR